MESLLDDIWLEVFGYIDANELMNSRVVCRHWDSLVLQKLHNKLTCHIDLSQIIYRPGQKYSQSTRPKRLKTAKEEDKPYYEMMNKLSQMSEFLSKHAIKRVCINGWNDRTPNVVCSFTTMNNDNEDKRSLSDQFLHIYSQVWHPLMSQLASVLRNCTHLRMRGCELNRFVWKWLFGHCDLTELDIEECCFDPFDWTFEEVHWPATVCISPTPRATLAKLRIRNRYLLRSFFKTVNLFVDSLINVRQFEYTFDDLEMDEKFYDKPRTNVNAYRDVSMKELVDFIHSSR